MAEQCSRYMLSGGRCDLEVGHEGEHEKQYPGWTARWTDEGQSRLAERTGVA